MVMAKTGASAPVCFSSKIYRVSLIGSKVNKDQKTFFSYKSTFDLAPYFEGTELNEGDLVLLNIDRQGNLIASFKNKKITYKPISKKEDKQKNTR